MTSTDREWDTLVEMIATAQRGGRRALREIEKFYDKQDEVDCVQVAGYASVLLEECMFQPADWTPTEAEVRELEARLYPAWSRIARGKPRRTLLNLLMTAFGYEHFSADNSGLNACTHMVIAIAVLLPRGVDVESMRSAVYRTNELLAQIQAERDARVAEAGENGAETLDG